MSNLRTPEIKTVAGSTADSSAKVDLTASYAKVGSAVNVSGAHDLTLQLREHADSENASLKFYLAHDGGQPTSSTGMYQVTDAAGAEVEVVLTQNTRKLYNLAYASKWFLLEGKGASGTTADLSAFLTSNITHIDKSRVYGHSVAIAGTAVTLTASYTAVGNIVDASGLSNMSLFVDNSGGSANATIKVFADNTATAKPSAQTNFHTKINAAGSDLTFVTLSGEKAVHSLGNFSARWLGIQGVGNTASIKVHLAGSPAGI